MDWIYHKVGNFGLAILIITVLIKIVFFPLANKSYASMAKMKAVQPEMMAIRERYGDDKMKQQQAMMELYKKEKINPVAGCLPILIQIPVFFALYKVLFITIEMRHAPFFGWIKDLSAPDPLTIFNLFGLIPWDPTVDPGDRPVPPCSAPWPLIMGVTMWFQMKLNPPPPDPTQKMIFDWMPIIFTFMLASFSAGLVIYWAWNNTLSVLQQSVIMHKHGAKIELFDNLKDLWRDESRQEEGTASEPLERARSDTGVKRLARRCAAPGHDAPHHDDSPLHPRRDRSRPQAVRGRLAIHLGRRVAHLRCRRCAASRSPSPAAPMSASRA